MLPTWKKKKAVKKIDKPDLIKKLDRVFSRYIRLRDAMPNGMCRCISCGRIKPLKEIDAGHFHSRRFMSTRFDPMNVNGECRFCNSYDSDHLLGYRENLIRKIGVSNFNYLTVKANQTKKWEDWELEKMIEYYTAEVNRLSVEKGIKI